MFLSVADLKLAELQASLGLGLPYTLPDLQLIDLKAKIPNPDGSLLSIADFLSKLGSKPPFNNTHSTGATYLGNVTTTVIDTTSNSKYTYLVFYRNQTTAVTVTASPSDVVLTNYGSDTRMGIYDVTGFTSVAISTTAALFGYSIIRSDARLVEAKTISYSSNSTPEIVGPVMSSSVLAGDTLIYLGSSNNNAPDWTMPGTLLFAEKGLGTRPHLAASVGTINADAPSIVLPDIIRGGTSLLIENYGAMLLRADPPVMRG